MKQRDFLSFWCEDDKEALLMLLRAITDDCATVVLGVEGHNERGHIIEYEVLLLPLTFKSHQNNRILGVMAPFETPYWLGVYPILHQSVKSVRLIWPDEKPVFMKTQEVPSIIEHMPTPIARHGHLRVYQGGRQ